MSNQRGTEKSKGSGITHKNDDSDSSSTGSVSDAEKKELNIYGAESDSEEESSDNDSEDDEDEKFVAKKAQGGIPGLSESEDEEDSEVEKEEESDTNKPDESEEYDEIAEMQKQLVGDTTLGLHKMQKLTPEQLEAEQKRVRHSGVVYLSSIPPYMKPVKLRQIMERFGKVGRIFLKPEDSRVHKSRVKSGGNKKRKFTEGWCEFKSKKHAKLAAETLNGNTIGGKKRGFYHDDILNVKYLKGFKWGDLTRALNREKEVRESKFQAELSKEQRLNKAFIDNVENSKKFNNIRRKRKLKDEDDNKANAKKTEVNRMFKQRSVVTNRAKASKNQKAVSESDNRHKKLTGVLNKLF